MDYAIIAAGEGSRLVNEGIHTPKPLIPINGIPLIGRLIDVFIANEASSIHVIVNEEMTEVRDYLTSLDLPVAFNLHVETTPSSMHSFYALSGHLHHDHVCLTTVDTIFRPAEFSQYIRAFLSDVSLDGMMAVTDFIDDEKPLYVQTDKNLMISGFSDVPVPGCRYISGGIYCLRRTGIDMLQASVEAGISRMRNYQRQLVEEGLRLRAFPFSKIIDVDHADDIPKAYRFLSED